MARTSTEHPAEHARKDAQGGGEGGGGGGGGGEGGTPCACKQHCLGRQLADDWPLAL